MNTAYKPVSCGFHDELQYKATTGVSCAIAYRDFDGTERLVTDAIADVYTREGAEYLRLRSGEEIRLDRLIRVDDLSAR